MAGVIFFFFGSPLGAGCQEFNVRRAVREGPGIRLGGRAKAFVLQREPEQHRKRRYFLRTSGVGISPRYGQMASLDCLMGMKVLHRVLDQPGRGCDVTNWWGTERKSQFRGNNSLKYDVGKREWYTVFLAAPFTRAQREATQMLITGGLEKQNVVYPYNEILFSFKKERDPDILYDRGEP